MTPGMCQDFSMLRYCFLLLFMFFDAESSYCLGPSLWLFFLVSGVGGTCSSLVLFWAKVPYVMCFFNCRLFLCVYDLLLILSCLVRLFWGISALPKAPLAGVPVGKAGFRLGKAIDYLG